MRLHAFFRGRVQGVGFRYTVQSAARRFPVDGWVRNCSDGSVELVAEGQRADLETLLRAIQEEMSGFIQETQTGWEAATGEFAGFRIVH